MITMPEIELALRGHALPIAPDVVDTIQTIDWDALSAKHLP